MRIVRFTDTPEGGSRFEELEVALPQPYTDEFGNTYQLSRAFGAEGVVVELPAGLDQDWHVAPNRQLVALLSGRIEVETTDGEVRRWGPGGLFLADDTRGKGHRTRVTEGPAALLFLRLAADFRPEEWARR